MTGYFVISWALLGDSSTSFPLTLCTSAAQRRKVAESGSVPSPGFDSLRGSKPCAKLHFAARNWLQTLPRNVPGRLGTLGLGLGTLHFCTSLKESAGAGGNQMRVSSSRGSAAHFPHLQEAQDLKELRPRGPHKASELSRKHRNTFSSARSHFRSHFPRLRPLKQLLKQWNSCLRPNQRPN